MLAIIPARGGSKGLPGKNVRILGAQPLIWHSIQAAMASDLITRVVVSTDDVEIATVAKECGAEVPFMRPQELALDDSSEWLVWRHAINYLEDHQSEKVDGLVVLPVTAPLRFVDDVNSCIDEFEKGEVDSVITVSEANRSPYFNMVVNDKKGYSSLVISLDKKITRRQDSPKVFDMTTVAYIVNTDFIKTFNGIFDGKVRSVCIPTERAIDIDTVLDFRIAECLLLDRDT